MPKSDADVADRRLGKYDLDPADPTEIELTDHGAYERISFYVRNVGFEVAARVTVTLEGTIDIQDDPDWDYWFGVDSAVVRPLSSADGRSSGDGSGAVLTFHEGEYTFDRLRLHLDAQRETTVAVAALGISTTGP